MPEPPQRRKPATDLELRVARGDPTAKPDLVDFLDGILHHDLQSLYPTKLPDDERERIVVGVISDFDSGKVRYALGRASIETLAKLRARRRAIDWIRHQKVIVDAQPHVASRAALLLVVDEPGDAAAKADLVERLVVEIEQLPQNLRRAALAYMRHAESDPKHGGKAYSSILAEELGVSPGLVAQWWRRALKRLRAALNVDTSIKSKRSKS